MRALLQRVSRAEVRVASGSAGAIRTGLLCLVGVTHEDDEDSAAWLARKVAEVRLFPDAEGRMNLDVRQAGGAVLVVPQFTLYGDARRGRRPDFVRAARPEHAEPLVARFASGLETQGVHVERGVFGAAMQVELVNEGPVTLLIETPAAASP